MMNNLLNWHIPLALAVFVAGFSLKAQAEPDIAGQCTVDRQCICQPAGGDAEKGYETRCLLQGRTISQAYGFFRRNSETESPFLKTVLPSKNMRSKRQKVTTSYRWAGAQKLTIDITSYGERNRYVFTREGNDTLLHINSLPL